MSCLDGQWQVGKGQPCGSSAQGHRNTYKRHLSGQIKGVTIEEASKSKPMSFLSLLSLLSLFGTRATLENDVLMDRRRSGKGLLELILPQRSTNHTMALQSALRIETGQPV